MRHNPAGLRVLVVLPFPPDREGGAAARCAVALLQGLQARRVDCRALAIETRPSQSAAPGLEVELVRVELSRWQARWNRLVHPGSALIAGHVGERLRQLAAGVDLVHLVGASVAGALWMLDCPAVLQLDTLTVRDREIRRPWTREEREALETLRAERRALRRADWVLVSSPEVADALPRRIPRSHRVIAPLALDAGYYAPQASLQRPLAGLIGTARWPPTTRAVRRLLTRVWPLVIEQRPTARLMLAGEGMEAAAFGEAAHGPGVEWRGRVASASQFLRELGVLLYPPTSGGGVKVKVLEALALGVPVVCTAAGAEGLIDHGGIILSDDDAELAAATVALLDDAAARREAGVRAHANFLANHTPAVAAGPVVELYQRMLASRPE